VSELMRMSKEDSKRVKEKAKKGEIEQMYIAYTLVACHESE